MNSAGGRVPPTVCSVGPYCYRKGDRCNAADECPGSWIGPGSGEGVRVITRWRRCRLCRSSGHFTQCPAWGERAPLGRAMLTTVGASGVRSQVEVEEDRAVVGGVEVRVDLGEAREAERHVDRIRVVVDPLEVAAFGADVAVLE